MTAWVVERRRAGAAQLHGADLISAGGPALWVLDVERPALVLGSSQPEADVDAEVAVSEGIEVARRRSGGGAVLLHPGELVWLDVVIPRGDPRWDDDVARSSHWLGDAWTVALGELGSPGAVVHRERLERTPARSVACFAAFGPGEVSVGGEKAVGISQRRTREGARFQCVVMRNWDAALHERLLAPGLARVGAPPGTLLDLPVATVEAPAEDIVNALTKAITTT